jgi:2-C-methyl-D-erythritol 4-phosphate cytidylyltransferase / 2-C-methyl-D-erythritol 2,4-cyclodiphosphate synthase
VTAREPAASTRAESIADAIVVAAGASSRMAGLDKVSVLVGGRPLIAHTLDALRAAPEVGAVVLVVGAGREAELGRAISLPAEALVAGGVRRQESVDRGWQALEARFPDPDGHRVVLVHDGARPLVSASLVGAVARAAGEHGAAIPVVPVAETLKRVEEGIAVATVERDGLATAQTPQGIRRDLLREAYRAFPATGEQTFTDEAALLEACRIAVHAIPGEPSNLKVTVPDDLRRVAASLAGDAGRIGYGHDRHPFGPGEPLALGGLEFAGAPRLHGHSDGDAALHATADALLGAAGLGDLGRLFPADDRTPRGIASKELVRSVVATLAEAGLRPVSVDLTIVAARPRLGARLDEMRLVIARLLGIPPDAVSAKASTGNLGGPEGEGRAIAAYAIARVQATVRPSVPA